MEARASFGRWACGRWHYPNFLEALNLINERTMIAMIKVGFDIEDAPFIQGIVEGCHRGTSLHFDNAGIQVSGETAIRIQQELKERFKPNLANVIDDAVTQTHATAKEKGFWDEDRNDAECIALMHSELSEALEAMRHGNPPDDKIPEFSGVEAELADVVIRVLDYAGAKGLRLGEAIDAKMGFNETRPHKHGKEF